MQRKGIYFSFFLFFFLAPLLVPCSGALAEESCVTAQCHSAMLKTKNIHPGAQPCDTCHQPVANPHPQKNKKTFKLVQEPPALCYMCHTQFGTKKDIHPPVKDGMCTTCHNPHDSDEPKLLMQPLKDLCLSCHPEKVSHKFVHGPAGTGDCTTCHNPHESDNKRLLVKKDVSEVCFLCHTDIQEELKKRVVHPAVLSGCTSCHNPHGGNFKRFLSAQGKDLCFQCHPDISDKIAGAKTVHPPVNTEKGCASCHSPHASDNEKMLFASGKNLCLSCHKEFMQKNWTVLHGPIKQGKCTPCHNPHGSPNQKLLDKEFPVDFYAAYNDKEYELCFSCHNRELLQFPDTSFATGFRDGERNLHYVHVNKEKGRTCRICHSIHGGTLPKLINEKAPFGKWQLPLHFVKTESGGSCAPGCHQKFSYDRKKAVKEGNTLSEPAKN